ncbi:SH3 domain-containing protein [Oceanobacillus longus]|uniref:SH3 domain-containing protein n=1 Tax=Oceanobacillus longus TaxID=930120 RepID=A0ABV8GYT3_9BACI
MDRKKGIIFALLLILTAAFIVFVAIMQHNFANPEFAVNDATDSVNKSVEVENDAQEAVDTETSEIETDRKQTETEDITTYSKRIVTVDSLHVRSGPGTDFEISGVLTLDEEVEVEDDGIEWVKITTADFTGYVNEKYLTENEE